MCFKSIITPTSKKITCMFAYFVYMMGFFFLVVFVPHRKPDNPFVVYKQKQLRIFAFQNELITLPSSPLLPISTGGRR